MNSFFKGWLQEDSVSKTQKPGLIFSAFLGSLENDREVRQVVLKS